MLLGSIVWIDHQHITAADAVNVFAELKGKASFADKIEYIKDAKRWDGKPESIQAAKARGLNYTPAQKKLLNILDEAAKDLDEGEINEAFSDNMGPLKLKPLLNHLDKDFKSQLAFSFAFIHAHVMVKKTMGGKKLAAVKQKVSEIFTKYDAYNTYQNGATLLNTLNDPNTLKARLSLDINILPDEVAKPDEKADGPPPPPPPPPGGIPKAPPGPGGVGGNLEKPAKGTLIKVADVKYQVFETLIKDGVAVVSKWKKEGGGFLTEDDSKGLGLFMLPVKKEGGNWVVDETAHAAQKSKAKEEVKDEDVEDVEEDKEVTLTIQDKNGKEKKIKFFDKLIKNINGIKSVNIIYQKDGKSLDLEIREKSKGEYLGTSKTQLVTDYTKIDENAPMPFGMAGSTKKKKPVASKDSDHQPDAGSKKVANNVDDETEVTLKIVDSTTKQEKVLKFPRKLIQNSSGINSVEFSSKAGAKLKNIEIQKISDTEYKAKKEQDLTDQPTIVAKVGVAFPVGGKKPKNDD